MTVAAVTVVVVVVGAVVEAAVEVNSVALSGRYFQKPPSFYFCVCCVCFGSLPSLGHSRFSFWTVR